MENSVIFKKLRKEFKSFLIDFSKYQKIKCIGKGDSGEVWCISNKKTHQMKVLKQFFNEQISGRYVEKFLREQQILKNIKNPFLNDFYGFIPKYPFSIVTKLSTVGSLKKYLQKENGKSSKTLSQTQKTIICMCIANAMFLLHRKGIMHLDLKVSNVLLDDNFLPKLCDIGINKITHKQKKNGANVFYEIPNFSGPPIYQTPYWMAPELLAGKKYTFSADVYSFGMLLYVIVTGHNPWENVNQHIVTKLIVSDGKRPSIPQDTSKSVTDLINQCWAQDPNKRPTFEEIFQKFENGEILFNNANKNEIKEMSLKIAKMGFSSSIIKKGIEPSPEYLQYLEQREKGAIEISSPNKRLTSRSFSESVRHMPLNSSIQSSIGKTANITPTSSPKRKKKTIRINQNSNTLKSSPLKSMPRDFSNGSLSSYHIPFEFIKNPNAKLFKKRFVMILKQINEDDYAEFFTVVSNYFNDLSLYKPTKVEFIINSIINFAKSHRSSGEWIIKTKIPHSLPYDNKELSRICLDLLHYLFETHGHLFDSSFEQKMDFLIESYTRDSLIMLQKYAQQFDTALDPWKILDLLIVNENIFMRSPFVNEFASTLYFLCSNFEDYKNARQKQCVAVFIKLIEANNPKIWTVSLNALILLKVFDPQVNVKLLIEKLKNNINNREVVYQYILHLSNLDPEKELLDIILEDVNKSNLCFLLLCKFAGKQKEWRNLLISDMSWLLKPFESLEIPFRLLLILITEDDESKKQIVNKQAFYTFLHKYLNENKADPDCVLYICDVFASLPHSPEVTKRLKKAKIIRLLFSTFNETTEINQIQSLLNFIDFLSSISYFPQYLLITDKLSKLLKDDTYISPFVIPTIANLSKYEQCTKAFIQNGLVEYFQHLKDDKKYTEIAMKFIRNAKIVELN